MSTVAIVVLAAVSLCLAALLARSRARARAAARRVEALEKLATVADSGGSVEHALSAISAVLVPAVADFCMIDVIVDGRTRRAAVRVAPGGPEGAERDLGRSLSAVGADAEERAVLGRIGTRSLVSSPLRARRRLTGALTLGVAWSGRRYGAEDERFIEILSGGVALALDNAGLFTDLSRSERAREEIAATLQRGLLPPPLPHMRGWSAAAMYRPAGAENDVGGDFYDAFPVAGGWMLVVGDVTGRGARAASIAGQARYTLRTAATLTGDPLAALTTLNRALLARPDGALCSVAAFAISEDPAEPVRMAVAGHPPPLLVDGDTVNETARPGPLLGAVADAEWRLEKAVIEPGQQLVVITDGITDAVGAEGRFGEVRLRAELAGTTSPVVAVQRLESALHDFSAGPLVDDAAILALARSANEAGEEAGGSLVSLRPLAAA